jgi:hypothetical protein
MMDDGQLGKDTISYEFLSKVKPLSEPQQHALAHTWNSFMDAFALPFAAWSHRFFDRCHEDAVFCSAFLNDLDFQSRWTTAAYSCAHKMRTDSYSRGTLPPPPSPLPPHSV